MLRKQVASVWHALCGLVALIAVVSCSERPSGDFDLLQKLPIPEGAYDVQKLYLHDSPKNQQLFFKIDRRYPATDVLDLYNGHFRREQWTVCRSSNDKWSWFLDKSSEPSQYVHQTVSYWINPDSRMFAAVSGRYFSSTLAVSDAPDNSVQRWAILVQRDVNALDETKRLSLRCN